MLVKVLGAAAGGGFPQWNCNCRNCADVRPGRAGLVARTQCSVAVSSDARTWIILDAAPDLPRQIASTLSLHPSGDLNRSSPIRAVVLTGADVDHVAGLLSLREDHAFTIYGSERVLAALAANPMFNVLEKARRVAMALDAPFDAGAGLVVEAFVVPGKIARYLEDASAGPNRGSATGDTIGLRVSEPASDAHFFYVPCCAAVDPELARRLTGAPLVLFDGTLFGDDELIAQGLSAKTGRRMGHISMAGADGSIAALASLGIRRRLYIHLNNSNPVLRPGSPERTAVAQAGWEIGEDGMEITL